MHFSLLALLVFLVFGRKTWRVQKYLNGSSLATIAKLLHQLCNKVENDNFDAGKIPTSRELIKTWRLDRGNAGFGRFWKSAAKFKTKTDELTRVLRNFTGIKVTVYLSAGYVLFFRSLFKMHNTPF